MKEIDEQRIGDIDDHLIYCWGKLINRDIVSALADETQFRLGVQDETSTVIRKPSWNGYDLTVSLATFVHDN